ncbi:hypothetical protein [Rhodococcoides fascians]|uniref:hypothetical protein n=1 Tax=Rhodococcoides fascians TaxID=1828 RepID=UPI000522EB18|nr:hypothetical protein [Rhodococcus fascians]
MIPITVVKNRGIAESRTRNLCSLVTQELPPSRFRSVESNWLAQYGPIPNLGGIAYKRAVASGVQETIELVAMAPGPVILLGYSGGAHVSGDAAAQLARGDHGTRMRDKIRGVGLFADPCNPPSDGVRYPAQPKQWGIAGARHILGPFPVWRANDPSDVIPLCDEFSPLRTISDQTEGFSLVDPVGWGVGLLGKLVAHEFQQVFVNWRDLNGVRLQYAKARADFNGYRNGDHTSYAIRLQGNTGRTYVQNMISSVSAVAT